MEAFRIRNLFRDLIQVLTTYHFRSTDMYGVLLHLVMGQLPSSEKFAMSEPVHPVGQQVFCPELLAALSAMVQRCSTRAPGMLFEDSNVEESGNQRMSSSNSLGQSDSPEIVRERSFAFHSPSDKVEPDEPVLPAHEEHGVSQAEHIAFADWALSNLLSWVMQSSNLAVSFSTGPLLSQLTRVLFAFALNEADVNSQSNHPAVIEPVHEARILELMSEAKIADHFTGSTAVWILHVLHHIVAAALLHQDHWSKQLEVVLLSPPPASPAHHISFHTKFICRLLLYVTDSENLTMQRIASSSKTQEKLKALALQVLHMNNLGQVPLAEFVFNSLLAIVAKFKKSSTCMTAVVSGVWRSALGILSEKSVSKEFAIRTLKKLNEHRESVFNSLHIQDNTHVMAMCHVIGELLMHDDQELRNVAIATFASLLDIKAVKEKVLVWQNSQTGQTYDLYTNCFELLHTDVNRFSSWLFDNYDQVSLVLSNTAEISWHAVNASTANSVTEARRAIQQRRRDMQVSSSDREMDSAVSVKHNSVKRRESGGTQVESFENGWRRRQQDRLNGEALAAARIGVVHEEVFRERGVWGAECEEDGVRWRLDSVEGPGRTRIRLERCGTLGAAEVLERNQPQSSPVLQSPTDDAASDMSPSGSDMSPESLNSSADRSLHSEDRYEVPGATAESTPRDDPDPIGEELDPEEGEEAVLSELVGHDMVDHRFACERVSGIDRTDALFLLCAHAAFLVDTGSAGSTKQECEGEIITPASTSSSISSSVQQAARAIADKRDHVVAYQVWEWQYAQLQQVHKRCYNLQPVAMELFATDGTNQLIVFANTVTRDRVYAQLRSLVTWTDTSTLMHSTTECGLAILQDARSMWCERLSTAWRERKLSNFEYLMMLNTLAGRTYNDLTQYPVFPWILAEYSSSELDLANPKSFRDLSKPMGAQADSRSEMFQSRYDEWSDPEIPKFHYGTHYSSPGIILSYLIRLAPFTEMFLKLQGGRFDIADRLFYSIEESWTSASYDSMADVKELIPEFFYLPEMFLNTDKLDMGEKMTTGEEVSHVELPTWANGDPWRFVHMHREALECEYVSAHLHEWIDLIFGYKQQGPKAIEAQNVFFHLTYADAIDIDAITDKVQRNATIAQINHFGQTPLRLFTAAHPRRGMPNAKMSSMNGILTSANISRLQGKHVFQSSGALGFMAYGTEKRDKLCTLGVNCRLVFPEYYVQYGDQTGALRLFHIEGQLAAVHEELHQGPINAVSIASGGLVSKGNKNVILVTGGTDGIVGIWRIPEPLPIAKAELLRQLDGHGCAITFVAASHTYSVVVSGDCRGRSILWDLNKLLFVRQLTQHAHAVVSIAVSNSNGNIATCCRSQVKVHSINGMVLQTVQVR